MASDPIWTYGEPQAGLGRDSGVAPQTRSRPVSQGNERSFEEFFAATYGGLVRLLFAFLHDQAQAEDAVQDAFASALVRWPVVRGYHDPEAWVRTVAFRRAIDHQRRSARQPRARPRRAAAAAPRAAAVAAAGRCRAPRPGPGPAPAPVGPAGGAGPALCGRAGRGPGRGRAAA